MDTLTRDDLNRLSDAVQTLDFDVPFTLYADGTLTTAKWAHAPEVFHVDDVPGVEMEIQGPWHTCLEGLSNQDGYRGPVMHAAEQISPGIVSRLLAEIENVDRGDDGAVFVIVAVEVLPDDEDPEPAPAGWTIMAHDTGIAED